MLLNAPIVTMGLQADAQGNYYVPTFAFSSDQSALSTSAPESVTISYTVDGGSPVSAATYVPTTAGEVIVTISATGYTSSSTTFNVPYIVYKKTTTLDFTADKYPSGADFTKGDDNVATAYNSSNKNNPNLSGVSAPAEYAGYLAFQDFSTGGSGNGWGIRVNGSVSGLFNFGNARAGAVLGRTEGQIVAFNCNSNASQTITYKNGSDNPDGNYQMFITIAVR